jgi:ankyrin repeat protein
MKHCPALNGDGETIDFLIKNGADINKPAKDGWTPLHAAAATFVGNRHSKNKTKYYSKYDVFRLVLKAKPDLTARTKDGWTALHSAVVNAHTGYRAHESEVLNKIIDLINAGIDVEVSDINGRTALHWAAWQGYNHFVDGKFQVEADVVDVLIEMGAEINSVDNFGNTPLHYASTMGYEEIVYALVKAGAKKDIANDSGQKPIDLAIEKALSNTIYILENNEYPEDLKNYIDSKSVNFDEGKLGKELLNAAWSGDVEEVKKLISEGADLGYRDTDGLDAMDRAQANGHDKIVQLLKDAKNKS